MPRRNRPDYSGLCPWFGLSPLQIYWAKGRTKGVAQKWKGNIYGGA
jgi:hypothetical protein